MRIALCLAGLSMLADIVAEVLFWGRLFPVIGLPGSLSAYIRWLGYRPYILAACVAIGLVLAVLSELLIRGASGPEKIRKEDYLIPTLLVFNIAQPLFLILSFSIGVIAS